MLFILGFHQGNGVKGAAAEQKLVGYLIGTDLLTGRGGSVRVQQLDTGGCTAVGKLILIHGDPSGFKGRLIK